MHTLDTGRGCPFTCSFCTIINVQGHDPRYRSAAAIVNRVRRACGEERNPFFFFTDDNFARNPHWKNPPPTGFAALSSGQNCRDTAPMASNNRGIPSPLQGDK
jgi:radical SAM superfamily enzyme YgiQ (UPF0313 family)